MTMVRECAHCGGSLVGRKDAALYCGPACKDAAAHQRRRVPVSQLPVEPDTTQETIEARTRADLVAGKRFATPLGAAAVRAARILDASSAVMGYASLMKQWQDTLEAALAGAVVAADEVDELRALRDRKFAG